jgi:hypothetical protein
MRLALKRLALVGFLLLLVGVVLPADAAVLPAEQGGVLLNGTASAVAGTATVTLTGIGGLRVHIYYIRAVCSAGAATLTVTDGATARMAPPVGTTAFVFQSQHVAWTANVGNTVTVSLSTCGASNTGTVDVQADSF